MSLLTFIEDLPALVSGAEAADQAVTTVLPELEAEEATVWTEVQPALAAVKTSFAAILAAGGFIEKVEDVPAFLGKCATFVGAVGQAEVQAASSAAVQDALDAVKALKADVETLLGSPAAQAQTAAT